MVEILKILLAECYYVFHIVSHNYLIIIKFVGILLFLNRVMYTRGYPSEFISYTLENICVKFHAFIRSVTKISLRDWTISLECFIEITPDFLCPFMND